MTKELPSLFDSLPREVYALVSGGGDSTAAALIAEEDPGFVGVVYIDTGTALPGVREHVELLADVRGWPLTVLDSGDTYEQIAAKFGLPGPGFHSIPYRLLKERRLRDFYRVHGRVRLITGVRRHESVRRFGNTTVTIHRRPSTRQPFRFESPIIEYTPRDVDDALADAGVARSAVSVIAGRSGECNCGAFAEDYEAEMLSTLFPEWGRKLRRWEKIALDNGRWCVWGKRPPPAVHENQERLFLCQACSPRVAA